jgi:hypothetical protein
VAYARVVAVVASLQQPSGRHKSPAKGSDPTEHAASSEAATRRMSLRDMSRLLCGMPGGTTIYAQVATESAAPEASGTVFTPQTQGTSVPKTTQPVTNREF